MNTIHTDAPATHPSHADKTASARGSAPGSVPPSVPKEISAFAADPLTVEALTQSAANPATALETPPPPTAEATAAATSSFTSIDAKDRAMSIEALIDLMAIEMKEQGEYARQNAVATQKIAYRQAQDALEAQSAEIAATAGDVKNQAIAEAVTGFSASIATGLATYLRPNADGRDGKKGLSAGAEISGGAIRGAGELWKSEHKQEEILHNAESAALAAVATAHQKFAETTAASGVATANDQIRAADDVISKNETGRSQSRDKINRL